MIYNIVDVIARSNSLARACIHNSMVHARAPSITCANVVATRDEKIYLFLKYESRSLLKTIKNGEQFGKFS